MNATEANKAIDALLKYRHRDEIIIPEAMCAGKGRAESGVTSMRLDYWVVKLSWSRRSYTGYEAKVSRADFLRDHKTQNYERQCTAFIWVTRKDVVHDISEIPANHGWQELSANGKRLITRKKAPRLKPDEGAIFNAMKSCFMRMMKPQQHMGKKAFFEYWLHKRELDREFGWKVSKAIRETVNKEVIQAKRDNDQLRLRVEKLERIERLIEESGIRGYTADGIAKALISRAKDQLMGIPDGSIQNLTNIQCKLGKIVTELKEIKATGKEMVPPDSETTQ